MNETALQKGTGFSRAAKANQINRDLQTEEKPNSLKGTGFSPYINPAESHGFSRRGKSFAKSPENRPFRSHSSHSGSRASNDAALQRIFGRMSVYFPERSIKLRQRPGRHAKQLNSEDTSWRTLPIAQTPIYPIHVRRQQRRAELEPRQNKRFPTQLPRNPEK